MSDLWTWVAHYSDGTTFAEYEDGVSHGFAEVDQSRLVAFQLVPNYPNLPTPHVVVTDQCRVVFFRRRIHTLTSGYMADDPDASIRAPDTIHVLGWQQTVA